MKGETEIKAKLYDVVESYYNSLDVLAKKLQDDYAGIKSFEQSEEDRLGLCFLLDYTDDLREKIKELHENEGMISAEKKLKINATLQCKQTEIKPRTYEVSEVITLTDKEYGSVLKDPLKDREYLAGRSGADTCVLLIGEHSDDGILVDTQGYAYPRYSAFIPNAREIAENFVQSETENMEEKVNEEGQKFEI